MKGVIFAILLATVLTQSVSKHQCLRNILDLGPSSNNIANGVRGSYDIKALLTFHDVLPKEIQTKITSCGLSLDSALNRCESAYGKANCEKLSPVAYQTKCDKFFKRVGCCHCAMECPVGWTEDDYHCIKPAFKSTPEFANHEECSKTNKNCEQRGAKWSTACGHNFRRLGAFSCLPICPEGWHDEGKRCRKPADYRMAQPFLWQKGDN